MKKFLILLACLATSLPAAASELSMEALVEATMNGGHRSEQNIARNRYRHPVGRAIQADADRTAGRREFQCIADQVFQHPLNQPDVGVHHARFVRRVHVDGDAFFCGFQFKLLVHVVQQFGERKPLQRRLDTGRFQFRQLKQVTDQAPQVQRVFARDLQGAQSLFLAQAVVFKQQGFHVTMHRGQWCAQVM